MSSGAEGSYIRSAHAHGRHRAPREVNQTEPRASRDEKESGETTGTQRESYTLWPPTLDVRDPGKGALAEGTRLLLYLVAGMVQHFEPLLELSEKTAFILYTLEANVHVPVTLASVLVMSNDAEDAPLVTPDYVRHFSDGTRFIG